MQMRSGFAIGAEQDIKFAIALYCRPKSDDRRVPTGDGAWAAILASLELCACLQYPCGPFAPGTQQDAAEFLSLFRMIVSDGS